LFLGEFMGEIKVLGDLEHIRLRPGMYIGNNYNPDHLVHEILDNSLDELVNRYANIVTIDFNSSVTITDNGRGIPIHDIELDNGTVQDSITTACTMLKSGAKFDNKIYQHSIGLHGIGLVAVNALSEFLDVTVKDRKDPSTFHNYRFEHGILISQASKEFPNIPWSTRIEFKPDKKHFINNTILATKIVERLKLVQAKYPKSTIIVNDKELPKSTMEIFIRQLLKIDEGIPLITVQGKFGNDFGNCWITYDSEGTSVPHIIGDTNLHLCGGQYLNNVKNNIIRVITNKFPAITRNDALAYVRIYVSVLVQDLEFDSQSKKNMIRDLSNLFGTMRFEPIPAQPHVKAVMEKIITERSMKRAARKIKKTKKKRVSAENPLKDCRNTPGDVLYLLEGESADGPLSQVRDKNTEASLPISGKILNVLNASPEKAVNSKKFKFILEALGVQLGKKKQNYRYKKVKILCDADSVGAETSIIYIDKTGFVKCDQIQNIYTNNDIAQVYSLNERTGQCELKKVKQVIKHNYEKDYLNRITTDDLNYYDCTDDHVNYISNSSKIVQKSPLNIDIESDYIVTCPLIKQLMKRLDAGKSFKLINNKKVDFKKVEIRSVEKVKYDYDHVYDLEVEDNNNFPVGFSGAILHNSDGYHIATLLIIGVWKYAPSLIYDGNLILILPPLYGAVKKKEFIPIYYDFQRTKYESLNYEIIRFKGLGEMNPEQLKVVVKDYPVEYTVQPPKNDKEARAIMECITSTELKRKLCEDKEHFSFMRLLNSLDRNKVLL